MADPLTLGMCRDMLRHIYMLQGIGFIESELAAYKAFEVRRFAQMPPVPVIPIPAEPVAPVTVPVTVPVPAPVVPIPAEPVAPAAAMAAPAPVPTSVPAPVPVIPPTHPICTILKEGALPAAPVAVPVAALASASAGAGAVPAPAENKIIDVPAPHLTEKRRYERSEIPDEHRCTQLTARGSRCTLGREAATAFCHRHLAKKQSGSS